MDERDDANAPEATRRADQVDGGRAAETANGAERVAGESAEATDDAESVDGGAEVDHERRRGPLEPGQPKLENALFVALGALGTVALFATVL